MIVITIFVICFTLLLTIPTIIIAVRSSMSTNALELRVSALETMITTAGATQKAQMAKMTKNVSDIQRYIKMQAQTDDAE